MNDRYRFREPHEIQEDDDWMRRKNGRDELRVAKDIGTAVVISVVLWALIYAALIVAGL